MQLLLEAFSKETGAFFFQLLTYENIARLSIIDIKKLSPNSY